MRKALRVVVEIDRSNGEAMVVEHYRFGWSVLHRCPTTTDALIWRKNYLNG